MAQPHKAKTKVTKIMLKVKLKKKSESTGTNGKVNQSGKKDNACGKPSPFFDEKECY